MKPIPQPWALRLLLCPADKRRETEDRDVRCPEPRMQFAEKGRKVTLGAKCKHQSGRNYYSFPFSPRFLVLALGSGAVGPPCDAPTGNITGPAKYFFSR